MARPSTALLSARTVGDLNRAAVLRALVVHGPSSRSDLARLANVTRATIGTIVQGLIDDGLLEELEAEDTAAPPRVARVGKPARPVWFVAGAGTVAAIELRSRLVRGALVDARGHLDHALDVPISDASDGAEIERAVLAVVERLKTHRSLIGIGISAPGTCDAVAGEVLGSIHVPGAVGYGLAGKVAAATGVAVRIENNTRAEALAEQWFGKGRRVATFATVQTGVGLGAGIVLDGALYRGPGGYGGEVGHTAVVLDGERCVCGRLGCWETVATLRWLRRAAKQRGMPGASRLDAARLAARGDAAADALLGEYADHLAIGIANLHGTLGVELFILHGDAVGGATELRDRIRRAARHRTDSTIDVELTDLDDAALLGAAGVVLTDLLHTVTAA